MPCKKREQKRRRPCQSVVLKRGLGILYIGTFPPEKWRRNRLEWGSLDGRPAVFLPCDECIIIPVFKVNLKQDIELTGVYKKAGRRKDGNITCRIMSR